VKQTPTAWISKAHYWRKTEEEQKENETMNTCLNFPLLSNLQHHYWQILTGNQLDRLGDMTIS
jgi:hypothetical protein